MVMRYNDWRDDLDKFISKWVDKHDVNPDNEKVYEFLDDIQKIPHRETDAELLEVQFSIPSYIADEYVIAWSIDRS